MTPGDEGAFDPGSSERTPLLAAGASDPSTPLKPGTPVDRHLAIHLPPSLAGLDELALQRMDASVTRKVDTLLLPILIVLYILNFIDRNSGLCVLTPLTRQTSRRPTLAA